MEQVLNAINEQRAHTDASLDAERTALDSSESQLDAIAQQALDDLIEHDRILADTRLLKLRNNADNLLARDRSASPSMAGGTVAQERRIADSGKKAERANMDAHVQDERQRADFLIDDERKKQDLQRAQLEACRQDTNDQLSSERHDTDIAVIDLGQVKDALALAESQRVHYADILGIVSHDLRSPLMIIATSAQAITEDTDDTSIDKLAQLITQAAARMERLVGDLLDTVRIQSGTLRNTKQQHGIDVLLAEVLKTYEPLFANRKLTFTIDMPATAIVAWFDYDRIVQVFSNLLGNAMKFTPRGGNVVLHVQQRAHQIEFSLSDTGHGISSENLPHIFERFWQIENNSRRGLGLGLYICKAIIEAHGGTIAAESTLNKGTTIRFTLPLD